MNKILFNKYFIFLRFSYTYIRPVFQREIFEESVNKFFFILHKFHNCKVFFINASFYTCLINDLLS